MSAVDLIVRAVLVAIIIAGLGLAVRDLARAPARWRELSKERDRDDT